MLKHLRLLTLMSRESERGRKKKKTVYHVDMLTCRLILTDSFTGLEKEPVLAKRLRSEPVDQYIYIYIYICLPHLCICIVCMIYDIV